MMVDYGKKLKAKFEIEGITEEDEMVIIGKALLEIYNLTADYMNNGGIKKFNSAWSEVNLFPVYTGERDEYTEAYDRYFKRVADLYSNKVFTSKYRAKLRESEPVLINFEEGYFTLYGYIDTI